MVSLSNFCAEECLNAFQRHVSPHKKCKSTYTSIKGHIYSSSKLSCHMEDDSTPLFLLYPVPVTCKIGCLQVVIFHDVWKT